MKSVTTQKFNNYMKPITAEEAGKLAKSSRDSLASKFITEIYSSIASKAELGQNHLSYPINNTKIDGVLITSIIAKLKELGYEAEHSSGHDCRDGDSWNNLNVSW
jgi:hypothetical protein